VLKPRAQRTATARQIIDRLRPQFAQVPGANVFLTPTQDINVGARIGRGSYQYTLQDPDVDELIEWSQKMLQKLRTLPQLADATSDLLANAPQLKITINRDQAARFGISPQLIDDTLNDAYGQRQITQYYTQLNTYFIILEILPELQSSLASLDRLFVKSPLTGGVVPLSLPPHHDDDRRGVARRRAARARQRHRLGAAPAASLCHGRRACAEPAAHALHHAGGVPLS